RRDRSRGPGRGSRDLIGQAFLLHRQRYRRARRPVPGERHRARRSGALMNHFHTGQHVRLTVAELGSISGQVIEVADDHLIVSLFLGERRVLPDRIEYDDVMLEYTAMRGLYRRRGTGRFNVAGVGTIRFLPAAPT